MLDLYFRSKSGWDGTITWPDGRSFLQQPVRLIAAFDALATFMHEQQEAKRGPKADDKDA